MCLRKSENLLEKNISWITKPEKMSKIWANMKPSLKRFTREYQVLWTKKYFLVAITCPFFSTFWKSTVRGFINYSPLKSKILMVLVNKIHALLPLASCPFRPARPNSWIQPVNVRGQPIRHTRLTWSSCVPTWYASDAMRNCLSRFLKKNDECISTGWRATE